MTNKRCGNCGYLDRSRETNIGGLRIAKCSHPIGVMIGETAIKNDYVALDSGCDEHADRFRQSAVAGGRHV